MEQLCKIYIKTLVVPDFRNIAQKPILELILINRQDQFKYIGHSFI